MHLSMAQFACTTCSKDVRSAQRLQLAILQGTLQGVLVYAADVKEDVSWPRKNCRQQHGHCGQLFLLGQGHRPVLFTFARGARQLVVQEALDTMWSLAGLYFCSFTPMTYMGASAEGAEMITFLAPPFR